MDAVETATRIRAGVLSPVEAVVDAVDRAKHVNGELNAIIAERYFQPNEVLCGFQAISVERRNPIRPYVKVAL